MNAITKPTPHTPAKHTSVDRVRDDYMAEVAIYRELTEADLKNPLLADLLAEDDYEVGDELEILIGVDYDYHPGTPPSIVPGRPDLYDMGEGPGVEFEGLWFAHSGKPVPGDFLTAIEEDSIYEMICDQEEGNWW